MQKIVFLFFILTSAIFLSSCRSVDGETETTVSTNSEMAQQLGDVMSSIDEASGSAGSFAWMNQIQSAEKSMIAFASEEKSSKVKFIDYILPKAIASSCFGSGFSACTANTITRDFNDCTLGAATLSGSVALTFSGPTQATCKLSASSDQVTRNPNFTISTSGASVSVTKTTANGEVLTYVSGTGINKVLSLSNDGIRRVITSGSTTLYDVTTSTLNSLSDSTPITVTGSDRSNRVLSGGTLRLQNNLGAGERCHISPSAVTWSGGTCTCATSGTWSGTCETQGAFTLSLTGCGTGNLTVGTETAAVTFTRCLGT